MSEDCHSAAPPEQRTEPLFEFGLAPGDESWVEQLRAAEALRPVGHIGPYELLEEISRGGQGIVYRAVQPRTGRIIALKRLLAGSGADRLMWRRFEREVEALTSLNHPNVVRVFGMDIVDGVPLLAMEWIEGQPITHWAAHGPAGGRRSVAEVLRAFLFVCDAVQHAHQHGIIHRDLKPSNVLVDGCGAAHVLDFGVAKLIAPTRGGVPVTQTEQFVGTLAYASPEQLTGRPADLDVRSDIYALGVLLFELLTSRLPYELGDGLVVAARTIEQIEPMSPRTVDRRIGRELEAVVLKALAKDKRERYQSVDALVADVRAHLAGEPVSARLAGRTARWTRFVRRHSFGVAFAATVFLLLAALVGVTGVMAARVACQRDAALAAQRREAVARAIAEHEAARAQAVAGFLEGLLTNADPWRAPSDDLSLRQLLDSASARVEGELKPEDRPLIRLTLARAYSNLGAGEAAGTELHAALRTLEQAGPASDGQRVAVLTELSMLHHMQGQHEPAGSFAARALTLLQECLDRGEPAPEADLNALAGWLVMRGDAGAAERLYRQALAAQRAIYGDGHPLVADYLAELSSLLAHMRQFDQAIAMAHEGIRLRKRLLGEEHADVAADLHNLATIFSRRRDYPESEAVFREALALRRKVLGSSHPQVAELLYQVAHLHGVVGDWPAAVAEYREALEIYERQFGPDHQFVGACAAELGRALCQAGPAEEAETQMRRALTILAQHLPPEHLQIAKAKANLGSCLRAAQRYAEAETLLLEACTALQSRYGEDHRRTRQAAAALAELYDDWGRPDQAGVWMEKAGAVTRNLEE